MKDFSQSVAARFPSDAPPEVDERAEMRRERVLAGMAEHPGKTLKELSTLIRMNILSTRAAAAELLASGRARVEVSAAKGDVRGTGSGKPRNEHFAIDAPEQPADYEEVQAHVDGTLHIDGAPAGFRAKGMSTQRRVVDPRTGREVIQWVKTERDPHDPQLLLESIKRAVARADLPARAAVPVAEGYNTRQLTVYPIGDPHLGLYAWCKMTGQDWNLEMAEYALGRAADHLVNVAPRTQRCCIIPLGDYSHSDNMQNRTARSGHPLDVSDVWPKVQESILRVTLRIVDRALEKHEFVDVMVMIGNHDDQSAMMLSLALTVIYRNNPRVRIDEGYNVFRYLEFGKCLIGAHHGHTAKKQDLAGIMAVDRAEAWGRTKHRYIYVGHFHHEWKTESMGVIIEGFRTMAGPDNYTHSAGYRSGRSMVCDVLDIEYGRIARHEVGIDQLRGEAA